MWTTVFTDEFESVSSGKQSTIQNTDNDEREYLDRDKNNYNYLINKEKQINNKNNWHLNNDLQTEEEEVINANTVRGCWEIQQPLQFNAPIQHNQFDQTKKGKI